MMQPIFNGLKFKGLSYAINYVKGVFLTLNSLQVAALHPMFSLLGLSKGLSLSSLNLFLGSSKNSFKLV